MHEPQDTWVRMMTGQDDDRARASVSAMTGLGDRIVISVNVSVAEGSFIRVREGRFMRVG